MRPNKRLFLLWRLVLIPWGLKAIHTLKVKKLRKLSPCSTLYGDIIISETQVLVQGFTTHVCIMYNAKDMHALAGTAKEGNDLLVWMEEPSGSSFCIWSRCLNKIWTKFSFKHIWSLELQPSIERWH